MHLDKARSLVKASKEKHEAIAAAAKQAADDIAEEAAQGPLTPPSAKPTGSTGHGTASLPSRTKSS